MTIEIAIPTCNSHMFLLKGFAYLFNKYFSSDQSVRIFSNLPPSFELPPNFKHSSLHLEYPVSHWTNAVYEMTTMIESEVFILMLEDYWLSSPVNVPLVTELYEMLLCVEKQDEEDAGNFLRIDLTSDLSSRKHRTMFKTSDYEIIEASLSSLYLMSYQASIWSKRILLKHLVPQESPWDSEIFGTDRISYESSPKVLGTLNAPMKYSAVHRVRRKTFDYSMLSEDDVEVLRKIYG